MLRATAISRSTSRQGTRNVGNSLADRTAASRHWRTCREYLFQLRWPGGFCCPRCAGPWYGQAGTD
ncbi:MAG: transposase [Bacteroidia bacterium]